MMQHAEQHRDAIKPTVRIKNEVSADIFDDKVRPMGSVTVSGGKIVVLLGSFPGMATDADTGAFILESIALGVLACWEAHQSAFES